MHADFGRRDLSVVHAPEARGHVEVAAQHFLRRVGEHRAVLALTLRTAFLHAPGVPRTAFAVLPVAVLARPRRRAVRRRRCRRRHDGALRQHVLRDRVRHERRLGKHLGDGSSLRMLRLFLEQPGDLGVELLPVHLRHERPVLLPSRHRGVGRKELRQAGRKRSVTSADVTVQQNRYCDVTERHYRPSSRSIGSPSASIRHSMRAR
jgi:hypothetical protein